MATLEEAGVLDVEECKERGVFNVGKGEKEILFNVGKGEEMKFVRIRAAAI
ncbi:MAG: hypothetical protein VXZ03_03955 [Actinomycetota bacterium]|nr:hypothetical protein [Actinomycetota bacterium]MEE3089028.1 hypothetical protein [Actinomycetota bacterium]